MNILIHVDESKVELMATNLEVGVRVHLRAKVDSIGSFTVPAKTLSDYVHLLRDEQVTIELQDNELLLAGGNSSTKIKGVPAEEFPILPEVEEKFAYAVSVQELRDGLEKTVIAVAKNEIRPELSGLYMSFFGERHPGIIMAATDSYRLAEKKISVLQGKETVVSIVPGRTVYEIIRLLSLSKDKTPEEQVRLWVSENQIAIRYGEFEMTSRLVDGKYPDYSQIIPTTFRTTAVFPADVAMNKIKAASLFTANGVNAVTFDLNVSEKTVGISSTSTQTGEHSSEIDADVSGEENSIVLNHKYVLDGLQKMDGDVECRVNSHDAPCIFQQKGKDDYLYIVMPIRQ